MNNVNSVRDAQASLTAVQRDRLAQCNDRHTCTRFLKEELGWRVLDPTYPDASRCVSSSLLDVADLITNVIHRSCIDTVYVIDSFGLDSNGHAQRNAFLVREFSYNTPMWNLAKSNNMLTASKQSATIMTLQLVHDIARERGYADLPVLPRLLHEQEYDALSLDQRIHSGRMLEDACYATLCALQNKYLVNNVN